MRALLSYFSHFARLFVPLSYALRYFRSKMIRKTSFSFSFCSLIRTLELRSKVLSLENDKKNKFFFLILLAYSYLCTTKH